VIEIEQKQNEPRYVAVFEYRQVDVEATQQFEQRVGKRENHERDRYGHEHNRDLFLFVMIEIRILAARSSRMILDWCIQVVVDTLDRMIDLIGDEFMGRLIHEQ